MFEDLIPLVLDQRTRWLNAGFAGDDAPKLFVPSFVAYCVGEAKDKKEFYVGSDAQSKRGVFALRKPLEYGIIANWDDMEKIWDYVFHELHVDVEDHCILLTDVPHNPRPNREKMVQVMFEKYSTPATFVALQAILSFYYVGRTSGIACELDDGTTHILPIYEGYTVKNSILRCDISGRDINESLKNLLARRGDTLTDMETLQEMKEQFCYVAADLQEEEKKFSSGDAKEFKLPDGNLLTLRKEREFVFRVQKFSFNLRMAFHK